MSFHSFLKLKQTILLVELSFALPLSRLGIADVNIALLSLLVRLSRHIGIWMMLVEELNGMESAAVDVEVDSSTTMPILPCPLRNGLRNVGQSATSANRWPHPSSHPSDRS